MLGKCLYVINMLSSVNKDVIIIVIIIIIIIVIGSRHTERNKNN